MVITVVPVRRGTVGVLTELWFGRGRRDSAVGGRSGGGNAIDGGFGRRVGGVGHGDWELGDLRTGEEEEM